MQAEIRVKRETFTEILRNVYEGGSHPIPVQASILRSRLLLTECDTSPEKLWIFSGPADEEKRNYVRFRVGEEAWRASPLVWQGRSHVLSRIVAMGVGGVNILSLPSDPGSFPPRISAALPSPILPTLSRLRVMVVGTSRTGSHLAWGLLRLRPEKLILVDPDIWEPHHRDVPALLLNASVMKHFKTVSLAETLRIFAEQEEIPTRVIPIPRSVWDVPLDILSTADVVVSAVDNLPARLYVDVVTEAFRSLLIDVGVEVSPEEWGGAVRIFWPDGPRLRHVVPVDIPDWITLCRQCREGLSFEKQEAPHGALPGVAQITAGMAQLAFLQVLRGGLSSGMLRWSWQTIEWTWHPWSEKPSETENYAGRGARGLEEFHRWLDRVYG